MKKILLLLFYAIALIACIQTLSKIREDDIKKFGISYESEELLSLGIEGTTIDKEENIRFYVDKITPDTRKVSEQGLVEIFRRKNELYTP